MDEAVGRSNTLKPRAEHRMTRRRMAQGAPCTERSNEACSSLGVLSAGRLCDDRSGVDSDVGGVGRGEVIAYGAAVSNSL